MRPRLSHVSATLIDTPFGRGEQYKAACHSKCFTGLNKLEISPLSNDTVSSELEACAPHSSCLMRRAHWRGTSHTTSGGLGARPHWPTEPPNIVAPRTIRSPTGRVRSRPRQDSLGSLMIPCLNDTLYPIDNKELLDLPVGGLGLGHKSHRRVTQRIFQCLGRCLA